jgi:tyrosyl-tRNA synthetase
MNFLPELEWRGMLKDITDRDGLSEHLAQPRRIYCGFDPTADSLTIGNLVPIMVLAHAQRAGHTPVVVMGGGTGLIGDPSGKSAEREFLSADGVARNVAAQHAIFESLLDFDPGKPNPSIIRNNLDWLGKLGYIEVLRDIGKYFSVNMMIQKDSVRERLHAREQGISYTEFSYMILQAFDFLHLNRKEEVTIQCGGSDQWGNIVAGVDLIRRVRIRNALKQAAQDKPESAEDLLAYSTLEQAAGLEVPLPEYMHTFAFTFPLVTKADGTKFGKTESSAIWLTAQRTSPYAYYQFWLNTTDADVGRYLRIFTFLPREEIEAIEQAHAANPGAREAQRRLAQEATTLLHGREHMEAAEHAARALFSGDITGLDEATLREVFAEIPSSDHPKADLEGEGLDLVRALTACGLASSNREAREFLGAGSITVNGRKVAPDDRLTTADLLPGAMIALRRGKKTWRLIRWH